MKIITWNLGYWQHQSKHLNAWEFLRDKIRPDIVLLQEFCPVKLINSKQVIFREIYHGWGTAIYIHEIKTYKEIKIDNKYSNRIASAVITLPSGRVLYLFSIHAPIINGRVFPYFENIFDDIESKFGGQSCVIGGDLNSARLAEEAWPDYGHGSFFERIDHSRLVDIRKKFFAEEIQTVFRPRQKYPFQDDHIFVSVDLSDQVISYEVINNEITREVSDHLPVMINMEI